MNEEPEKLGAIVRELESDFTSGGGTLMSKYVTSDLYDDINTIYAYLNSKHISGEYDDMGREKPFFNIVLASRNIWFRATDLDRKNIVLTPRKEKDTIGVFLLNVHLQNWMTKSRFGTFLNTWGLEESAFNSSVVKFIEKEGELISSVIPWSRLIVDQINFKSNPKIELLELTEAELYDRGYDEEQVKALCDTSKARETTGKQRKDNKKGYYKLYEVHGNFPLSYITEKEKDYDTYCQQMHVLSFVGQKKQGRGKTEYDEFTLYKGKEEKDPYMLTSLLPATDGSISLDGSVKNLFQAQWMINHTKKAIKDQLDVASKLIFQTSDGNFVGQNALSAIEQGDIMIHAQNQPLTQLQNNSHDIVSLQNFGAEWKGLSSEINGVSEAMLGVAPKSGTAWKQTEALLTESHSLFEIMTENKALDVEDMLRTHIIPFLKKKMDNADEVTATLDMYGIKQIEDRYIKYQGIRNFKAKIKRDILNGKIVQGDELEEMQKVKEGLTGQAQRFFAPSKVNWKKELKDLETDVEIIITDEAKNTQEVLQTLNTALTVIANPMFQNNPKAQFVIDKILQATGHISPLELSSIPEPTPMPQNIPTPLGGAVGGMNQLPVTTK